jgi:hypothetical protein
MSLSSSSLPENSIINDIRTSAQFRGITFSKYKKTEVRKQLVDNMMKSKIEPACYWASELICAGHFAEVWECIFYFVGKHIHTANPKIIVYLEKRHAIFRNIITQGHFVTELQLRNNDTVRKIFAEIITVVSLSEKKNSFEPVKINRVEEFDITQMTDRLKATDTCFASPIMHAEDPKELFIAINEFAYHISSTTPNMLLACYWIEWVIEFDILCKSRKEPCLCKRRKVGVETKFQRDIIWVIWDTLIYYSSANSNTNNTYIESLMHALRNIFCVKYTTASCKKRKYLLYFAVELLTDKIPANIPLIQPSNKAIIENVTAQIHQIYAQIKKNEESPNTDYLFSNLEAHENFENSVRKIEIMQNFDFVPRS